MVNNYSYRAEVGRKYLKAVEWSISIGWSDAYNDSKCDDAWFRRMALIHPDHYRFFEEYEQRKRAANGVCPIRGRRNFESDAGSLECQSNIVWGYVCDLEQYQIVNDHQFPYSLGGPTLASNKIYLCKLHNALKAADIHFFKWECEEPIWLDTIICRIGKLY